jgi:hypothetical protein
LQPHAGRDLGLEHDYAADEDKAAALKKNEATEETNIVSSLLPTATENGNAVMAPEFKMPG